MKLIGPSWSLLWGLVVLAPSCGPGDVPAAVAESVAPTTTPTATAAAPAARPVDDGPARLVFDETVVDLGTVSDEGRYTARFTYYNAGHERLVIREVNGGCKCVTASVDRMELAPGEVGVLTAVLEPHRQEGAQPRVIQVLSNSPEGKTSVRLEAIIEPLLTREPARILWGEREPGSTEPFRFDFTYRDPQFEFQPVLCPRWLKPWIEKTGGPDDGGLFTAVMTLTPADGLPWGVHEGGSAIRAKIPIRATPIGSAASARTTYEVILMGQALGELEPEVLTGQNKGKVASRMDVGILALNKPYEHRLRLRRKGREPFQILGVEFSTSTLDGALCRSEPYGLEAHDIVLYGQATGASNRGVKGTLEVRTDLPGYESLQIDFQGVVR